MNQHKKIVTVRGKEIGGERPLICTPVVGMNLTQILAELKVILPKEPDLIEWRADFFENLDQTKEVMEAAGRIRAMVGQMPILFTIRSQKEGGQPISLREEDKLQLLTEVCKSHLIDLIDYELDNDKDNIQFLREITNQFGVHLILSYHNFDLTPNSSFLLEKLREAESAGADIAKVSVLATSAGDVLVLLQATQDAQKTLTIPVATMSMGRYGVISRLIGYVFGSAFTFAIGEKSSALGQLPIEALKSSFLLLQKSIGNDR